MYDESASRAACPMHDSSHNSQTSEAPRDNPAAPHDCCKSSGCQCHCGNLPLAFNLSPLRGAPASALVQPSRATQSTSAPPDTHFRPPILS
jgi:hypothetical protein